MVDELDRKTEKIQDIIDREKWSRIFSKILNDPGFSYDLSLDNRLKCTPCVVRE